MDHWSPSLNVDDEFEKLVMRMNPPRVTIDNTTNKKATLIKVDSVNKHGSLLEVVQILTDLNLTISRAYISSDGEWFMDDQYGNKLPDGELTEYIEQTLGTRVCSLWSLRRSVGVQAAAEHTTIELTGTDRPGLLSEIFAVLVDLKCNVGAAEVWTHNSRLAAVVYITDEATGCPLDDPDRLAKIKQLLRYVLKANRDKPCANTAVTAGGTHTERRLHQMMYADRDYDGFDGVPTTTSTSTSDRRRPSVFVENCADKGYTVVSLRCRDRPKLLFDTVCTLTDMQYVVFHAAVSVERQEASQEFYIKHLDGCPISSEAERERVIQCLEAAIQRRTSEGVRLELCSKDRVGLLSDVTRIFRENGLSVIQAEVTTRGSQAVNVFYVTDTSGEAVKSETIEAVRYEIGEAILHVKHDINSKSDEGEQRRFSLGNLFRSRSEKLLSNLGLIRSQS